MGVVKGKINWLLDHNFIEGKDINKYSKFKVFKNRVTFNVFQREENKWIKIDSFKSNFIGGLKYIQREFKPFINYD